MGSTKFTTISSISSTVRPGGNINIGTVGHNDINDDDSLVQLTNFSSGAISMNGVDVRLLTVVPLTTPVKEVAVTPV